MSDMPQNRHKSGFRGPSPDVSKATQFKPGNRANPGGRPKKTTLTDAAREWLKQIDPKTGLTNAEMVAAAQGRKARKGDTAAFSALADRTEGRPQQSVELAGTTQIKAFLIDRAVRPPKPKRDA